MAPLIDLATKPYMVREDRTRKNTTGFYGLLRTKDGSVMTEFSRGTPGDRDEPFGPTIVPGLKRRREERTGISQDLLYKRLSRGWTDERALTTPNKGLGSNGSTYKCQ